MYIYVVELVVSLLYLSTTCYQSNLYSEIFWNQIEIRHEHVIENLWRKSSSCPHLRIPTSLVYTPFTTTNKSQVCWKSVEGRYNNNNRDADTQSLRHSGVCFIWLHFGFTDTAFSWRALGASGQRRKVETRLKRRSALEALRQVKQSHETRIALTAYRKAVE